LRARDVGRRVIAPDVTLAGYLDQLAEQVLRSLGERRGTSVEATARAVWARLSSGKPNLRQTAIAMGISGRTLQRRLSEDGTSFELVLDDLRRDQSISLLHDRSLAVDEVAFLLGYSEPSTFYRAFRRWHGVTPGKYRAKILASTNTP
jgi:AraC-like DNA-binding protein